MNGGNGTNSYLQIANNVTLQGGGTLTLNVASGGGTDYIQQAASGLTLTNVNNTIQGAGVIGNGGLSLVNEAGGIINANSSAQALTLNGGPITNAGLLEATSGGTLQISGTTVNNSGGNITAGNGSTVQLLDSADIQGGTLNNNGSWFGTVNGNTVSLDGTTKGALTINGNYTSDLNTQTYLYGTINNNGNFQLNGGNGTNSYLQIANNVTLQGGGTLTLNVASGGGTDYIQQAASGLTLTNVDNTIQAQGVIGNNSLSLINEAGGTIDANSNGQSLTINGGPVTNAGLLESSNGGTLVVNVPSLDNSNANITANAGSGLEIGGGPVNNLGGNITVGTGGSLLLFNSGIIQGGTLTNNGLLMGTMGGNTAGLDGSTYGTLTIKGNYTAALNSTTDLYGTISNNGSFQVNGGSGTNSYLNIENNVTLQGGGSLTLAVAGGGGNTFIQQGASGVTLTNVDNTIQGAGVIGNGGLSFVNQASGTVNANSAGQALTFNGGAITNAGLFEATSGGSLQIAGITVNNGGGILTAGSGSYVQLSGSTDIQGGTLNNNGGWLGTVSGNTAYLDGTTNGALTINGNYTSDLNTQTYLYGTINNNGNFQLNGGNGTNSYLQIANNVTLQGGGTLSMNVNTAGSGTDYIQQAASGLTLTNVNNTIQGAGVIGNGGLSLVNEAGGIINANSSAQALTLNGGPITNAGLLEATSGGTLQISGTTVNNSGGNITAGNGSTVQLLDSADIQGGTLNNNGSWFGTVNGNTVSLDGTTKGALTINGNYTSDLNTQTYLYGTINNNGNFQLNGGNGTNSYLQIANNVTLQGGGTLTLNVASGGGTDYIQQAASGLTLTNVDNTIQGAGVIGNGGLTFVNEHGGTVLANAPGQTLELNGGSVTNSGTFQVNGGSTLLIATSFTTSGTVNIGVLNDHATSLLQMAGGNDYVQTAGTTTLWNAGSTLEVASGQAVRIEGGLLQGFGTIQGDLINSGTVHPGDGPGTLNVTGNFTQNSAGVLDIQIGGLNQGSDYSLLNVTGTAALAGTLDVSLFGGFTPTTGETFTILTSAGLNGSMFEYYNGLQEGNITFTVTYGPGDVILTAYAGTVPEPSSCVMLALGIAGIGACVGRPPVNQPGGHAAVTPLVRSSRPRPRGSPTALHLEGDQAPRRRSRRVPSCRGAATRGTSSVRPLRA